MVLDTDPTLASMRTESSTMARDRAISSTRLHRSTITNNTTWSSSLSNLSQPGQSTGSHATINSTKLDTSIPVTIRMYTKVKGHVSCSYCTLTLSINTRIMYPQSKYARMLMRGFSSRLIASPSSFARVGWISVVCRSRFFSKGAGMLLVLTHRSLWGREVWSHSGAKESLGWWIGRSIQSSLLTDLPFYIQYFYWLRTLTGNHFYKLSYPTHEPRPFTTFYEFLWPLR